MSHRHTFTVSRAPLGLGREAASVVSWAGLEFERLQRELLDASALELREAHSAPQRPRTGTVVYADGTDWNPRAGAGPYVYNGTAWVPLGTGFRLLGGSAAAVSHTGDTNETTLATVAIPAGALGANGALRVWTLWSHTNSANNKTLRVKLSTTAFLAVVATATAQFQDLLVVANRNSAASQVSHPAAQATRFGATTSAVTTGTVDTASAQNLTITAQLASVGETITLEGYTVEMLYRA